jgi:predicted membrane chloride channel (bestrophin family)
VKQLLVLTAASKGKRKTAMHRTHSSSHAQQIEQQQAHDRAAASNSARLLFACFASIIMQLWGEDNLEPMRELLSAEEYTELCQPAVNRPLLMVHWLTEPLREAHSPTDWPYGEGRRQAIWMEVSQMVGSVNAALKVAYTPIPTDYHIATRFILYAFCFANPICLAWYHPGHSSMMVSVLASAVITGLFFTVSFVSEVALVLALVES